MDYRKQIYCETAFWKRFRKRYPSALPLTEDSIRQYRAWTDVFKFMMRSNISFDCPSGDIKALFIPEDEGVPDQALMTLWKKHSNGEIMMTFDSANQVKLGDTPISDMKPNDFSAVYLTANECRVAKDYGVLNITSDNYVNMSYLFRDNGTAIGKYKDYSWDFLKQSARHSCNSMIIADNYLFYGDLENNLFPILDALLPDQLAKGLSFELSIFAMELDSSHENYRSWADIKKEIGQWFSTNRPNLEKRLELFNLNNLRVFHDRTIVTNYIWIESGGGFDLFKYDERKGVLKSSKSTTVQITYPFIQSESTWPEDAYINNLNDVNFTLKRLNTSSDNRLLIPSRH